VTKFSDSRKNSIIIKRHHNGVTADSNYHHRRCHRFVYDETREMCDNFTVRFHVIVYTIGDNEMETNTGSGLGINNDIVHR